METAGGSTHTAAVTFPLPIPKSSGMLSLFFHADLP